MVSQRLIALVTSTMEEGHRMTRCKPDKANHRPLLALPALVLCLACLLGAASAAQAASRLLAVTSKEANFRSGPSTKSDILFTMGRYYPVKVLQKKGNWYRVEDFENYRAWVHRSLLGRVKAVVVKAEIANIRDQPSTRGQIVLKAKRYVPFKVLGRQKDWLKVRHDDGEVGWMHRSLVWGRY